MASSIFFSLKLKNKGFICKNFVRFSSFPMMNDESSDTCSECKRKLKA